MGWEWVHRENGISNREFFEKEFTRHDILEIGSEGGTVYIAMRQKEYPQGFVFATIILTKWNRSNVFNFGFKVMDESVCPSQHHCPEKVFRLLSPLPPLQADEPNYAHEWRRQVSEWLHSKQNQVKLVSGACYKTEKPVCFGAGRAFQFFQCYNAKRRFFDAYTLEDGKLRKAIPVRFPRGSIIPFDKSWDSWKDMVDEVDRAGVPQ